MIADAYVDAAFGIGRREDHAGARLQRLRDGPAARPAADQHLHARREAQRERARGVSRHGSRRRAQARSSPSSKPPGLLEKIEPHKLKVPRGDRTGAVVEPYLTDQWYVKIEPLAEPAIEGRRRRPHEVRARELVEDVLRMDAQHPGLVHHPPALVGTPHPGVVRRRRARSTSRATKPKSARSTRCGPDVKLTQDSRRARHLVLLRAVAVLDARLARHDAGTADVLPDERARHRASTSSSSGSRA